jgi:diguanylate cyclase (GGDEF)-like protein
MIVCRALQGPMADISKRHEKAQKYLQKGKRNAALEEYLQALQEDPNNDTVRQNAADLCISLNRNNAAVGLLSALFDKQASIGDAAKANVTYKKLARLGNPSVDQTFRFAQLIERTNKKEAADAYQSALQGFISTRRKPDALAALRHVVQMQPTERETRAGRRREFVAAMKEIGDKHAGEVEFLELLVEVYDSANRESDYCATLLKLFELYYAAGNFLKASDSLDRAAEVDPYEPGHHKRLEMLRGKVDVNRFNAIAHRFAATGIAAEKEGDQPAAAAEVGPTVLEDFILQAEIFLQYSMRSKALEGLERLAKLFPREEEKNEKLRQLYMNAGFVPKYEGLPATAAPPAAAPAPAAAAAAAPRAVRVEAAVDNISMVTEITRNIHRQTNVKGVLIAAVNDIGRHWAASRCLAGLITPGNPPSAALEYCAPGVPQSEVMFIVKLLATVQAFVRAQGTVSILNAQSAPELAPVANFVKALGIQSLLAVPLVDGEEHVGLLVLEQCDLPRQWCPTDMVVLKIAADQMVLAVNNARLRSLMKTLAVTEEKSGLLKRSSYLDVLLSETRRALQQNSTLSIMLIRFGRAGALVKEIGEQAVESMMQQVGQIICSHIRQTDMALRYELTTIALVLGDTNDKNCFFLVDKLRKALSNMRVPGSHRPISVAVGIAEAVMQLKYDAVDIVTEVMNRAEQALENARAEGPNAAQSPATSFLGRESAVVPPSPSKTLGSGDARLESD